MKGFAPSFALMERLKATRKWPIFKAKQQRVAAHLLPSLSQCHSEFSKQNNRLVAHLLPSLSQRHRKFRGNLIYLHIELPLQFIYLFLRFISAVPIVVVSDFTSGYDNDVLG